MIFDIWRRFLAKSHSETVERINMILDWNKIKRIEELNNGHYVFTKKEIKQGKSDTILMHSIMKIEKVCINSKNLIILEHNKYTIYYLIYFLERMILKIPKTSWSSKKEMRKFMNYHNFNIKSEVNVLNRNIIMYGVKKQ